jgi:twitching motility protein PilT
MTANSSQTPAQLLSVDQYLAIGQEAGSSDIHLGVNAPPLWRLHGTLQPIWADAPPLTAKETAALVDSFLSEHHKTQLTERGDSDFK